jgi:hypothetical protein
MQRVLISIFASLSLFAVCGFAGQNERPNWLQVLNDRLPVYGHRNWIVVADSAYPAQTREGIETIVSEGGQMPVLRDVLDQLSAAKHVRPIVWLDRELSAVPEADAPGITAYRGQLSALLEGRDLHTLPHEQIISKLDATARTFRVLIIKTDSLLPYTSVFLQLDCAYWSAEAEEKLRQSIAPRQSR